MKLKTISRYRNILRAIGQGLENLEVKSFELEVSGSHYVVSGKSKKSHPACAPIAKKSFLSLIQNVGRRKALGASGSPAFYFSQLRFIRSDIELLDGKGKVLRSDVDHRPPNPHSISHVLRMAGAYLDHTNRRLIKLSWHHRILTLWYINGYGIETREVFTPPVLYELRGTGSKTSRRFPVEANRE